ncbi:uncharacterized protein EV420DRAFT_1189334 [Desarmillaria tabescens]|uniref:Uncharacterized protein n=1 Tax=Armillaria tabescens TaxID=1929756 RepID=A0AA39TXM4_ARMTA|nr:uncharacterized protein EV420DRAFT_1189334 [Desarmillaria tabescens]KAK0462465.1 hypothetical protein EV420DRAFT_1189334 [Desarmillaria tabescens]
MSMALSRLIPYKLPKSTELRLKPWWFGRLCTTLWPSAQWAVGTMHSGASFVWGHRIMYAPMHREDSYIVIVLDLSKQKFEIRPTSNCAVQEGGFRLPQPVSESSWKFLDKPASRHSLFTTAMTKEQFDLLVYLEHIMIGQLNLSSKIYFRRYPGRDINSL